MYTQLYKFHLLLRPRSSSASSSSRKGEEGVCYSKKKKTQFRCHESQKDPGAFYKLHGWQMVNAGFSFNHAMPPCFFLSYDRNDRLESHHSPPPLSPSSGALHHINFLLLPSLSLSLSLSYNYRKCRTFKCNISLLLRGPSIFATTTTTGRSAI